MPVYDKPMIYYPLTTLMLAGIREVLVITTPADRLAFMALLRDGSQWGMQIEYAIQERPDGLAQALIIGEEFVRGEPCTLVLGDNIFFGQGLQAQLKSAALESNGATIFGYRVKDPRAYGVAEFGEDGIVFGLEEKPAAPRSSYAVVGLYFYDGRASEYARQLKPSARGELEVTDLNRMYMNDGSIDGALYLKKLGRGVAWLDTGTPEALLQAANFVQTIQERQGLLIASPEEVAFRQGWIDTSQLLRLARSLEKTRYGQCLRDVAEQV
jgi:glucose-1-phosphate thymidylyltransferase